MAIRFDGVTDDRCPGSADGIPNSVYADGRNQNSTERGSMIAEIRKQVEAGLRTDVCIHTDDALYFGNRMCTTRRV